MTRLTIHGEAPSKKNSRINTRSGRSFPGRRFSLWHESAVSVIKSQWKREPVKGPAEIIIAFFHKDRRRRDSDNQTSSVLDTLVDAGVLEDDSWRIVRRITVDNYLDPQKKGRCEITVMEGEDDC